MKKIDMSALLHSALEEAALADANREATRRKTYDALLFHVKDFEYLTDTEEPTAEKDGFLTFSVGPEFRLRVECNIEKYYLHYQRCPKNSVATRRWDGGSDKQDVTKVCEWIARCIAKELSQWADPKEVTA